MMAPRYQQQRRHANPGGGPRNRHPGTELAVAASEFFFGISPFLSSRHETPTLWMVNLMRRTPGVVTIAAVAVVIGLLPLPMATTCCCGYFFAA